MVKLSHILHGLIPHPHPKHHEEPQSDSSSAEHKPTDAKTKQRPAVAIPVQNTASANDEWTLSTSPQSDEEYPSFSASPQSESHHNQHHNKPQLPALSLKIPVSSSANPEPGTARPAGNIENSEDSTAVPMSTSPVDDDLSVLTPKAPVPFRNQRGRGGAGAAASSSRFGRTPPNQHSSEDDSSHASSGRRPSLMERLPSEAISTSSEQSDEIMISPLEENRQSILQKVSFATTSSPESVSSELFKRPDFPERRSDADETIKPRNHVSTPEKEKKPSVSFGKWTPQLVHTPSTPPKDRIAKSHNRVPSFTIVPEDISYNSATDLISPQVSDISTPFGFLKNRRTSNALGKREVKETLTAHLSHEHDSDEDSVANSSDAGSHAGTPVGSTSPRHSTSEQGQGTPHSHVGCRKLNQYRLGPMLGSGATGTVEKATDVDTGVEYAVKEFSKSRLRRRKRSEAMRLARGKRRSNKPVSLKETEDDEKMDPLSLIRSEVAIMKKLDHPNLVRLYEVLDVPNSDSLYMVMELCSGGPVTTISLASEASQQLTNAGDHPKTHVPHKSTSCEPMSEGKGRNLFRQMLLGMEYLHMNDIVHRDIKPENILLSADHEVCKICDFGVSEMFVKHGDDMSTRHVGSPAFMSPELVMPSGGHSIHARATDIWALGGTLYCMVVGRLPFQSSNFLDLNDLILNQPAAIPHSLSANLQDLLGRMLDKDPETRIAMAELREHPWVTKNGTQPLPSQEENLGIIETPTEHEIAAAFTLGHVGDILSAKKVARQLRRNLDSRRNPKRGKSLNIEPSSTRSSTPASSVMSTQTGFGGGVDSPLPSVTSTSLCESPSLSAVRPEFSPRSTASSSVSQLKSEEMGRHHSREKGASVDDFDLDTVMFVEKATAKDVIKRDDDLQDHHLGHHRRAKSVAEGMS